MTDIALDAPTPSADATSRKPTARGRSAMLGLLAVVVLGGATTALFALEACTENGQAHPIPTTAPTTTTSSSGKPPVTAPVPSPAPKPPLPPPPT